jgi:hypothetical protein
LERSLGCHWGDIAAVRCERCGLWRRRTILTPVNTLRRLACRFPTRAWTGAADLSDLKAKGRFDDITYQMLTTHPLVVSDDNLDQLETASPHEDAFKTSTRVNLCVMWLREEAIRTFKAGITLDVFVNQMNLKIDVLAGAANNVMRIGRTPMPFVYAQFTKIVTWSYVLSAPFYLVTIAGDYSCLFVAVMAFFFLGLDEIAVQLEEPFGTDETDINLAGDCEFLARETACLVSARFARDFRDCHPIVYAYVHAKRTALLWLIPASRSLRSDPFSCTDTHTHTRAHAHRNPVAFKDHASFQADKAGCCSSMSCCNSDEANAPKR